MKPDCYKCKYRGNLPGDAHSCCKHPNGIKNGWFFWPLNFDPVWLENCDGFTAKKKQKDD